MSHIKRIIIECTLIVGIIAVIRGVVQKDPISEDVDTYLALKKRIAMLPYCECPDSTNLNLKATYWCICHPYININGKRRSEGETVYGYKIISITSDKTVFLCPEGHSLELDRPSGDDLWGSDIIGDQLIGDVPIGRPLETGQVQQIPEPLPELSTDYGCEHSIPVFTFDGKDYHEGDMVEGHTIIEIRKTEVVFKDPEGEEVVKYFYDYMK
jgi:hypothetical protein